MSRTVTEEHKELIHYTSASGLEGILTSQALWATHSSFLNDSQEISLFFERRLAQLLEAAVREELSSSPALQVLPQFARTPQEAEETNVRYAHEMDEAIRATAMGSIEPYIVSFCTAKTKRALEDGLLSQWRGYGKDGGYAIVFDAIGLNSLLESEARDYWYQQVQWGDVHYYQDELQFETAAEEIEEAEAVLKKAIQGFMKNPTSEELKPMFEPVATLSCLYKHWGFHEEREVRIVAIPPHRELVVQGESLGEKRPRKTPKTFIRAGCPVPYIELFGQSLNNGPSIKLPITRILVGPHVQKDSRKRAVEVMLEACAIDAEVVVSQIPYTGT